MNSRIVLIVVCAVAVVVAGSSSHQKKSRKAVKQSPPLKTVSYTKEVLPILHAYCLPCHTEDEMNPSQLYLDSYESMMLGGKHGPPVVAGKPDSSLMIRKIGLTPPFGDPMPLKRKTPFPQDTLSVLKKWIAQGAKKN